MGSYRENYRILSEPIGIRRKLLDVGKCRNGSISCRNPKIPTFPTPDKFLSESDAKDTDNFQRIPIGSDGVRLTWVSITLMRS